MIDMITHAPFYVWPLFAYLVFIGLKASKTSIISLKVLAIAPTIFCTWSFYSVLQRYGDNPLLMVLWAGSTVFGAWIVYSMMRQLPLRFDKTNRLVEMPGSWAPLVLSMSIFTIRYALGVTGALYPEFTGNWILVIPELIAAVISGMSAGRVIRCWQKFKTSSHVNLV
jgi:branched-subunit amino acid transport protein